MLHHALKLSYLAESATEALLIAHPKLEGFLVFKGLFSVV